MFYAKCWERAKILDAGYWVLDTGCGLLDARRVGRRADLKRQPRWAALLYMSGAAGLKNGQSNRERNFGLVLQINVFILVLKRQSAASGSQGF